MPTPWPPLPFPAWQDTCDTLHMWSQVIGKIRMTYTPPVNHFWHVPYYVTVRGITTSPIPYQDRSFQIDFDFIDHKLIIEVSDGKRDSFALVPMTVADFYKDVMGRLKKLGLTIEISTAPCEVPNPIPFDQDTVHKSYNAAQANRFFQVLTIADRIMKKFRCDFTGKASPVHFFWGSFDLAVTRFSGRSAPPHPGAPNVGNSVTREAYSHEVSSCGFWPGNGGFGQAAFYAYAYASPPGFGECPVAPKGAYFSKELGEFILPYEVARTSPDPDAAVMSFLQSTYEAATISGHWDRPKLERDQAA